MRIFSLILMMVMGLSVLSLQAQDWKELKGDHFIIYFFQDEKFAGDVLSKSEKYYQDIASDLGYQRYSSFWTWDNRVKIYIYPDKESFLKSSGQQGWSEGMADYAAKSISSYAWHEGFTEELLPHEITHLIFRDYVGFKGEIPLWIDEGVAQWMEPRKRKAVKAAVGELLEKSKLLPVGKMLSMDIRQVQDADQVRTFYIQAMSLVEFLITEYGSENFISFCRQLRDGKSFEEALQFSYPTSIRTIGDLETEWRSYIANRH